MSSLSVKCEVLAGTSFKEAVEDAKTLASKLGCAYVMFNFNNVSCSISADADVSEAEAEYENDKRKYNHIVV